MFDQKEYDGFFESDPEWLHLINNSFIIRTIYDQARHQNWGLIKFLSIAVKTLEGIRVKTMQKSLDEQLYHGNLAFFRHQTKNGSRNIALASRSHPDSTHNMAEMYFIGGPLDGKKVSIPRLSIRPQFIQTMNCAPHEKYNYMEFEGEKVAYIHNSISPADAFKLANMNWDELVSIDELHNDS
jgi:hypothetical protein